MLKSIGAVLGTYVLSVALVLCTDPLLSHFFPGDFVRGHVPSNGALVTSTALFVVISIFCAWLCARLAPTNALKHVLWLFLIGETVGVISTIPNWNKGWPHWYWLSWLITWPISCWIGLKFVPSQRSAQAAA